MRELMTITALAVVLAGCGTPTDGGAEPYRLDPAEIELTDAELATLCEADEASRNMDDQLRWETLAAAAPEDLAVVLNSLAQGPSSDYWNERETVEQILDDCPA